MVSADVNHFTSGVLSYDFTTASTQAFSNPDVGLSGLAGYDGVYCIYSGDVDQDGWVTNGDFNGVDNDNTSGDYHYANDIDGDGWVTNGDFNAIDNNNMLGIQRQVPNDYPGFAIKHVTKGHAKQKSSVN